MNDRIQSAAWRIALMAGLVAEVLLTGCGTPGAPQPPSLNLPDRVTDLAASRSGTKSTRAAQRAAFPPGADATFTDTLPAELAAGAPRPLSYFVELRNRNGRSAGLANVAQVLAGEAPAPGCRRRRRRRRRRA